MALCNRITSSLIKTTNLRNFGTQIAQAAHVQEDALQSFRTKENNPANHNIQHYNKFYSLPTADVSTFLGDIKYPFSGLKLQMKTFAECCILVRKPALEVINYLAHTDYSKPVNKYILYGEYGTGKSISLLHILHYGYVTNKILIYVPWAQLWFRFPQEAAQSETNKDLVDLPLDAARFLVDFKKMNAYLLSKANIQLSKTYQFGLNDTFEKGESINKIISFGINRAKYACDVISALFVELKLASIEGKCNILVAIDGFNAFYSIDTQVRNDLRQRVPASKVSLTHAFLELTKSDWCNGQIVITVDEKATKDYRDSYLPRYLLTKDGFNHLDPFLPIVVENYTQDEFETTIEYYKNRKWIRDITPEREKELVLLSGRNPYKLSEYCRHL